MEKAPIDLNTLEVVEPAAADTTKKDQTDPKDTTTEEEESEEESEDDGAIEPAKKSKDKSTEKDESEEESEEESEKEEEEESEESDEPDDKDKSKDSEPDKVVDEFLKEHYGKDYEIESKKDLDEMLEYAEELLAERDDLKKKLEVAEKADKKPKFESEAQEKAFEFLTKTGYDPSRFSEGIQTHAKLVGMDIEKTDPKMLMEEAFIIRHPELNRDEAQRKFSRDYARKYDPKRESFDTDAEYNEAKDDAEIDLKTDLARDRKYLREQQEQFKSKPTDKEEKPKQNEAITKSVELHTRQMDEFLAKAEKLTFSPTEDDEDDFNYKFSNEQLTAIRKACKTWVNNPNSYTEKGEFIGGFDPDSRFKQVAMAMFGEKIIANVYKHALDTTTAKRIEDLGAAKPTRKGKVGGDATKVAVNEEDQWEDLIKKKEKQRKSINRKVGIKS